MYNLRDTKNKVVKLGVEKVKKPFAAKIVLSFSAGSMVAFGFLAYLKAVTDFGPAWGSVIGAAIFPVGLIIVLVAGGELITGNMMVVGTSYFNKKVTFKEIISNWLVITLGNIIGAVFIAYVSVYLGLFDGLEQTLLNAANSKINPTTMQILVSGMLANWFVGLAVWMNVALKDGIAKIVGVWFPVMIFVYLAFQHSVANTFLLTAARIIHGIELNSILNNLSFSYLGNILGALILVSGIYTIASND